MDAEHAPIPALLAVSGLHHHLIREGTRTRVGLVLESGEPREVHHFALLIGYGGSAINPYLAFESLDDLIRRRTADRPGPQDGGQELYQGGGQRRRQDDGQDGHLDHSKLSRRADFRGHRPEPLVIDKYFTWTASRVEGIGMDGMRRRGAARATITRFPIGRSMAKCSMPAANTNGAATANITCSTRRRSTNCNSPAALSNYKLFKEYSGLVNNQSRNLCTLRGLFDFKLAAQPDSDRGSRAGRGHRQAFQDRRDELWLDQPGSARGAGHRHEPARRQEQHRRRRRRPGALRLDCRTATRKTAPSNRSPAGVSA